MPDKLSTLLEAAGIPCQRRVPMAEKTSLKVGGPARWWMDAAGPEDIARAMALATEAGVATYVTGNGSNLLVRDGGIDGLVINIGQGMAGITFEGAAAQVGAGARLSQLAVAAQAAGLSGLEAISGIPGTVGGAVYMNAGSYGVETGQLVRQALVLDGEGRVRAVDAKEMAFGYRASAAQANGWIVLGATLALEAGDPAAIQAEMRRFAMARRAKQPLSLPSAGSFFKRPPGGYFAGALIEQAGLKGLAVGGAQVSEMHAGFLVNTGGATAKDFLELMEQVKARVLAASGVLLEAEVRIVGCDLSY